MTAALDHDQLGRALVTARELGISWKELSLRYGYKRTRLWMIYRAALDRALAGGPRFQRNKDVHEHLSD